MLVLSSICPVGTLAYGMVLSTLRVALSTSANIICKLLYRHTRGFVSRVILDAVSGQSVLTTTGSSHTQPTVPVSAPS